MPQRVPKRLLLSTLALSALGSLLLVSSALRQPETPLGAELIRHKRLPSIAYGVHISVWWNETARARDFEYVRLMRFGYAKQIFGWRDIQPAQDRPADWSIADDVVAEANYRGIKLIARLGKPPDWAIRLDRNAYEPPFDERAFGAFCGQLAARYQGRIVGYQVWNEPNLSREWLGKTPNAAAYVKVLAACAQAIRAADPEAIVISAGLAPTGTLSPQSIPDTLYLQQMFEAGAARYYDVLGLNAPGYALPPETPPDDPRLSGHSWQVFRHVEVMRALQVAHGDGHKQIAILEMGWTTDQRDTIRAPDGSQQPNPYRWHAVSEAQQAEYLVAAFEYAAQHWRPWISLMVVLYLADLDWTPEDEEYWWALNEPGFDKRMRPAFFALANAPRYIDDRYVPPILDGINPYTPLPPRPKS
ncbi:MAG: hypothetical protein CUN49_02985 [Candidatus Thermofonsia Clade 1 bacterium]|jgi:hypothetical protein|uniref:Glycoside hydrolase family 5 domain-containing protein n=1 Tax=Candidatus Thermofonsia Clade 1 bacterium TaxID=2364210 RepID=A0A2M8PH89_9CHLR|nr:MAG: hypothetical protein CUN49_02985 [Candidatus Thermofonsia Clade 1 bacterium]